MSNRIGAFINEDGEAVMSNTAENWKLLEAFGNDWVVVEETTEEMNVFVEKRDGALAIVEYINANSSNP